MNKRLEWLEEVSTVLALRDIRTVHARAEEQAAQTDFRESLTSSLPGQSPTCACCASCACPFVKVGGQMLAMKSAQSAEETNDAARAVSILGGRLLPAYDYTIPGTSITHRVVRVEKTAPTPSRYPRRFAQIKKKPL